MRFPLWVWLFEIGDEFEEFAVEDFTPFRDSTNASSSSIVGSPKSWKVTDLHILSVEVDMVNGMNKGIWECTDENNGMF